MRRKLTNNEASVVSNVTSSTKTLRQKLTKFKFRPYLESLSSSWIQLWAAITGHDFIRPVFLSEVIMLTTFVFACFIITSTFSGELYSTLTRNVPLFPFQTLDALALAVEFKVYLLKGTASSGKFLSLTAGIRDRLQQHVNENPNDAISEQLLAGYSTFPQRAVQFPYDNESQFKRLYNEEIYQETSVGITAAPTFWGAMDVCADTIFTAIPSLDPNPSRLAIYASHPNDHLGELMSRRVRRQFEMGLFDAMYKREWNRRPNKVQVALCTGSRQPVVKAGERLKLVQLTSPFYLLFIGVVVAVGVIEVEFLIRRSAKIREQRRKEKLQKAKAKLKMVNKWKLAK